MTSNRVAALREIKSGRAQQRYQQHMCEGSPDLAHQPMPIRRVADVMAAVAQWYTSQRGADEPWKLTHFHSLVLPQISLADYAALINRAVAFGDDGMEIALVLIARACQPHIEPALNLSSLSMHRLLLTALRVATKAHHDLFASNKTVAHAGGISLGELNMLEGMFLNRIEFNVQVTAVEIARLRTGLRAARASAVVPLVMVKHFSLSLNLWPFAVPRPQLQSPVDEAAPSPTLEQPPNDFLAAQCTGVPVPVGGALSAVRASLDHGAVCSDCSPRSEPRRTTRASSSSNGYISLMMSNEMMDLTSPRESLLSLLDVATP